LFLIIEISYKVDFLNLFNFKERNVFMSKEHLLIKKSKPLHGSVTLVGAKNAVLTIMASLLLTNGTSILKNVPNSADVHQMITLLTTLGAKIDFDTEQKTLIIDTTSVNKFHVGPEIMNKMRASILVMGPLLARFGKANIALPGGCLIGTRPIDFHLKGFVKIGAKIKEHEMLDATLSSPYPQNRRIILEYPSVGATENLMMCTSLIPGTTTIVNAAFEPEVLDLGRVLRKMGARIEYGPGLVMTITGVSTLRPVHHEIIPDRLEAGSLLLAAAITGGSVRLTNAKPYCMDAFLEKLQEMGHHVDMENGITLTATQRPRAVNIKTAPYPGFPTDLQAPMMAALSIANGTSTIEETVFENRFVHIQELQKMGAQIEVNNNSATIRGVEELYGCEVIATDIRASCALAVAGLAAYGETKMTGLHHWRRGYDALEKKFCALGGDCTIQS
jgi:UDP-N-acetylglucosamine 1-carboxyvinyltransferase